MCEMLSYIFGGLNNAEIRFRQQNKINRKVGLFMIGVGMCAFITAKELERLRRRVDDLEEKLEENNTEE